MKARKKLLALALSALTGVSAFGLALHLTTPNTVSADTLPYTVTNLEDLVDSDKDIRWVYVNQDLTTVYQGSSTTYNKTTVNGGVTTLGTNDEYQVAIYDRKLAEGDVANVEYIDYAQATQGPTKMNVNANKYDGNYSFFANRSNGDLQEGGVLLPNVNDKNAVISFNMNYTDRRYDFYSRWVMANTSKMFNNPNPNVTTSSFIDGSYYGVTFNKLTDDSHYFIAIRNKEANCQTNSQVTNNSVSKANGGLYTKADVLAEANRLNGTACTDFDKDVLSEGDDINVTYGTYDGANGNAWTYFRLYNVSKELLLFDKAVDLGVKDTVVYEDDETTPDVDERTYPDGSKCMMKIEFSHRRLWDNKNYDRTPVTIAGVTEPLLQNGRDTTLEGEYTEGTALSTIDLPDKYKWTNGKQLLEAGTHEYEAVYKYAPDYYGTDYYYYGVEEKTCKVTVTANAMPGYTLTLQDMDGKAIGDPISVSYNGSYTFKKLDDREKAFVAYEVNGALYNVGDTFKPEGHCTITLLEADFKMNDKVSVRLLMNDTGLGGLRYTAQMPKAEWEKISSYGEAIKLTTMIIPTDLIVDGLDANETGAKKEAATIADMTENNVDYKIAMFAITDILHQNYDRKFTGAAFLTVKYADGDTAYVMTKDVKNVSAYDLAVETSTANAAAVEETSVGVVGANNVSVLERYINGVVDISYTVAEGGALTVALANNSCGYTLTNQTVNATEGGYNVSVTLNIADSILETLLVNDGTTSNAPVIVRAGTAETYTSVAVTRAYTASTNELVLTFVINA